MSPKRKKAKSGKRPRRIEVAVAGSAKKTWAAHGLFSLLIFLLTITAFLPSLDNAFVDWDDFGTILLNPSYRGLGWGQLRWMFTTFYMNHYQPLTWMTFGLDYLLWGTDPFGYHLTSLLLHAVNAVVFYFVAFRLLSLALLRDAAAGRLSLCAAGAFAALFFAIHPLRVESVAWVTERRDVLCGLFFLLTLLCYLRASASTPGGSSWWRWMSAAVFVYGLSLLSKASGMTLPIVLLALDVYPLRRLGGGPGKWFGPEARRVWWEKAPFLIFALAAGVVAGTAQYKTGAMVSFGDYGLGSRLAQTLFGLGFYLWKTIFPFGLSPIYYEVRTDIRPWDWPYLLSGLVVVGLSIAVFLVRRSWPAAPASWVYYVVMLLPVAGIAQSGPQLVADRYSYLSCLSWAVAAGGAVFICWRALADALGGRRAFMLAGGLAPVVLIVLGALTWTQAEVWHDTERLWRHALAVNPNSRVAHTNLGKFLTFRGRPEAGLEHFRQAAEIDPGSADAHFNLGVVLVRRGELGGARDHFRRAVEIDPDSAAGRYNLGAVLAALGEVEEAIGHFREALRIKPDLAEAREGLSEALAQRAGKPP